MNAVRPVQRARSGIVTIFSSAVGAKQMLARTLGSEDRVFVTQEYATSYSRTSLGRFTGKLIASMERERQRNRRP